MAGYIGSKAVLLSTTAATVTGAADIGGDLTVDTNTLYVDSTNNRVGVGTSSPNKQLHLKANSPVINLHSDNASSAQISFTNSGGVSEQGFIKYEHAGDYAGSMQFRTSGTERLRIDSSGNLLVGKTTDNITVVGAQVQADGALLGTRANGQPMTLNRTSSDGDIVQFRKDGTTVGSIGASGGALTVSSSGSNPLRLQYNGNSVAKVESSSFNPANDNLQDLGQLSARWDDVYATNGTIQTSDANEKQDIAELDEAEKRVAVAAKGLIRKYRWKDAVAEKGDDARIHVGIIAQDLQAAFEAEGLDAGRYAMFISSTWWEADEVIPAVEAVEAVDAVYEDVVIPAVLDEEGNEVEPERTEQRLVSEAIEAVEAQPERTVTHHYETAEEAPEGATERTRLGVRYPELLAFIIGAL